MFLDLTVSSFDYRELLSALMPDPMIAQIPGGRRIRLAIAAHGSTGL